MAVSPENDKRKQRKRDAKQMERFKVKRLKTIKDELKGRVKGYMARLKHFEQCQLLTSNEWEFSKNILGEKSEALSTQ